MLAAGAAALALARALLPGLYTNEEQVSFAREAGGAEIPWVGLSIADEGETLRLRTVDPWGRPGAEDQRMTLAAEGELVAITTGRCVRLWRVEAGRLMPAGTRGSCAGPAGFAGFAPQGLSLSTADGILELRRARPFRCWAAAPRPGGGWWSGRDLLLHDQGGRVALDLGEGSASHELRMRRVVWPSGPNRPSLVLYVHGPDAQAPAIAYAWADPGAVRVGINIRTLQASCTLDEDQNRATSPAER